jgi:hypothetical protein
MQVTPPKSRSQINLIHLLINHGGTNHCDEDNWSGKLSLNEKD